MNRKPYSAGAVKFAFWFPEFRKEIAMISKGLSLDEIKSACLDKNFFNASTPARAAMMYQTVTARIQELDASIYPLFQQSDLATQKLVNLTAIMMHESLFFDFMYEVFREKILMGTNELNDRDVRIFFRDKQLQDSKAATWTDQTLQRLGRTYKSYLLGAGLSDRGQKTRKLFKPILDPAFETWLVQQHLEPIIKALTGV
ncbi:hypothetical protein G153_02781 [Megasphaera sp. BL7]|uniref:DUF1819 family protein n=1 Tax=unclassified Megasphaera TaxID=2626256 RepID=UPI0003580FD1|nr:MULTISPECIES: DUF1819 family protein [unclassified Megasphaera]EPP17324.1 hypothetical protein G153_02781 [Megasphaera sp. BL7]EPP18349.1 hypothetical protein NM10_04053 [Megasphaera sp. NM10]